MKDGHIIDAEREWDKRCEAEDMRNEQLKSKVKDLILNNDLDIEILTESELTDDKNWAGFRDALIRYADGKLTIVDKAFLADKILSSALKYVTEVAERDL